MGFGINKWKLAGLKGQTKINDLLEKAQKAFELSRKLAPTNISEYSYLLEEVAEARATLAGDLIFDHVTFYVNFEKNKTNLNLKTNNKFQKAFAKGAQATADTIDNIVHSRLSRQEILQLQNAFGNEGMSVTFDYVYINVSVPSRVNKQTILGLDGTQKTFLGLDDYAIEFTGKTIGTNKLVYDVDTMKKFDALVKLGKPLKVSSVYLNRIWGIEEVVIESHSHSQSQELGQGNMVDFTISAVSNKEIPLIEGSQIKI